ncbi:hypothetical protein MCOR07_000569 [Pyricularia oryzae]|nr:hypothetical protein MCOR07_000569 [Pyricularia oryzae]
MQSRLCLWAATKCSRSASESQIGQGSRNNLKTSSSQGMSRGAESFKTLECTGTALGNRRREISTGQNQTSGVLSLSRRREIYKLCSQFDIILIEDNPYFNLYYPPSAGGETFDGASFPYGLFNELVPSFLRFDTEGRVIRLDSFSKSIVPGCRLGWIMASPTVCQHLFSIIDDITQQPLGFVQVVIARLLSEPDGDDANGNSSRTSRGFQNWVGWLQGLRSAYRRRMVKMATVLERGKHVATASTTNGGGEDNKVAMFNFRWPMGGMFLWVEIKIKNHPLAVSVDLRRLMRDLWIKYIRPPYLVLTVTGDDFAETEAVKTGRGYKFLRFCLAAIEEDLLEEKPASFVPAYRDF